MRAPRKSPDHTIKHGGMRRPFPGLQRRRFWVPVLGVSFGLAALEGHVIHCVIVLVTFPVHLPAIVTTAALAHATNFNTTEAAVDVSANIDQIS